MDITSGPAIIAPPASVDQAPKTVCPTDGAVNAGQEGFNEQQGHAVTTALDADDGAVVPAGTVVDSHFLFLNTGGTSVSSTEVWCFDGTVIGVMSDEDGLLEAASNSVLGGSTCYPGAFNYRGLEASIGDGYRLRGNSIELTMNVNSPGDWVRVVTDPQFATGATFSLDRQGPTVGAKEAWSTQPIGAGDILTVSGSRFRLPNDPVAGAGHPGVLVFSEGLGLMASASGLIEVDALSYGRDVGSRFVFSVDEWARGCDHLTSSFSGLCVAAPNALLEEGACTCICVDVGFCTPFDPATSSGLCEPPAGSVASFCEAAGDLFADEGPGNSRLVDGGEFGLVEPNPPSEGVGGMDLPDAGDNLDAIDLDTSTDDLAGYVFFSLEGDVPDGWEDPTGSVVGSATAAANGFSGADILMLSACSPALPTIYASAAELGLDPVADDLDALALVDDGDGVFDSSDEVYFSVRRGSAILGTLDSVMGLPITEGDILTPGSLFSPPGIAVRYSDLALYPNPVDDVDALDRIFDASSAIYGCGVNPAGSLVLVSGEPSIGSTVVVGVNNPLGTQQPGSLSFVALSDTPDAAYPCGSLLPGFGMAGVGAAGELLIGLAPPNPLAVVSGAPWSGPGTPAPVPLKIPSSAALLGFTVYAQGLLVDPFAPLDVVFGLTDGAELVIGP